jgi:hypothetical protein
MVLVQLVEVRVLCRRHLLVRCSDRPRAESYLFETGHCRTEKSRRIDCDDFLHEGNSDENERYTSQTLVGKKS